MTLQFQYPWVLYLLWMVPAAGILWHIASQRRAVPSASLVSPAMAGRLAPVFNPARRLWQMILFMTGMLLALIAAARPQWGMREETVHQRGRDLLIALDVSRSMLANDVHPSRLGRAKVDLLDLVKQLRGDRVGLIAFRGRPVLLCPLTTDYGFLTQALEGAGPHSAPRGETSIGDAIDEALKTFQNDSGSHRAIVLVSDGEDLAGRVEDAIRKAREQNVAIFTVGFGSTDGSRIPAEGDKKAVMLHQGTEVVSKLNHELLGDIATRTGGAYVPVGMANVKLGNLYRDHLSRIAAREQEESLQRRFIERYQLFLLAAVLCFLGAAYLSRGRIATAMRRRQEPMPSGAPPVRDLSPPATAPRKLALLLFGLGIACGTVHAATSTSNAPSGTPPLQSAATNVPPGRRGARIAQNLYSQGKYSESAAAYQAAARMGPDRDTWLFNAGCAYLKASQDEAAADAFRSVGEERRPQTSAAYNLGYSLARTALAAPSTDAAPDPAAAEKRVKQLKQAGAAFQQSLKLDPDLQDGRRNLAVIAAGTPEAESQARIARLMAQYQQTPPDQLAAEMLQAQRTLLETIPATFSNTSPSVITELEKLAADQDANADRLIPLKGKIMQALSQVPPSATASNAPSPQQQIAQVNAFVESLRDRMSAAAEQLRDLDQTAMPTADGVENGLYHLWKGIASYPGLLQEDLRRQTNCLRLSAADSAPARGQTGAAILTEQNEAVSLTRLFRERFEQQVPPEGLNAQQPPATTNSAATNAAPQLITPENRAKIMKLADDALARQQEAADALPANIPVSVPPQREAYRLLKEIEKLLPKQEPQSRQQEQQQQQQEQQQNQEQKQEQQPQEQPRQEQQPKPEERKDEMSQDDARRLLDKARQREKEHEQEKRERETYIPVSPTERDW